ncbi:hypothetical protein ACFQ44_08280 [Levilactobacillus lanxiensis]|uniref:Uncharacterized protein n=1 Tax=Levilactobacillus lanxiensis TaxID=2799568 RepID=A0ABW4D6X9_9LACO|nr:hypothetical protein [Levilactobacillus lanxiensis]
MSVIGAAIGALICGSYLCVQRTTFGQNIFNQIVSIIAQHGLAGLLLTITGLVVILLGYTYYRSLIGFHPSDASIAPE